MLTACLLPRWRTLQFSSSDTRGRQRGGFKPELTSTCCLCPPAEEGLFWCCFYCCCCSCPTCVFTSPVMSSVILQATDIMSTVESHVEEDGPEEELRATKRKISLSRYVFNWAANCSLNLASIFLLANTVLAETIVEVVNIYTFVDITNTKRKPQGCVNSCEVSMLLANPAECLKCL